MGSALSTSPPQGGGEVRRRWILGEKFDSVSSHKGSIKLLWEKEWRPACEKSVYPFHDGKLEDFEPIFQTLIAENINDAYSDAYTETFFPIANCLEREASMAFYNGDSETASELLRRAAVVYRISRFPYVSPDDDDDDPETNIKRKAFTRQKAAYTIATSVWRNPLTEHVIPHTHRAGRDGPRIPIYVRLPEDTAAPGWCHDPVPVVLIMTGLDGYRPDNSQRTHEITARGWAVVIAEIPGTGDSPADPADPESADRLWSSVLEYMRSLGVFDMTKVAVWGLSAGGYYAVRAAHTHRGRLKGCIGHGPGTHYFLDEEWLARVEDHEYPFPIIRCWAKKYGYDDPAEFCKEAKKKFSLLETGILDLPCTRLLLLNGIDDGIVPIEDCHLLFSHGSPKEGRFYSGLPHMGYPASLGAAYKWLEDVLGCAYVKN